MYVSLLIRTIGDLHYYLSTSGENLGAVLQVYEDNDILKAVMITGIRNNEELFGNELADIFSNTPPTSNITSSAHLPHSSKSRFHRKPFSVSYLILFIFIYCRRSSSC